MSAAANPLAGMTRSRRDGVVLRNTDYITSLWHRTGRSGVLVCMLVGLGLLLLYGLARGPRRPGLLDASLFQPVRVEPGPFPKHLIDLAGVPRLLPAPPQRIVSTILSGDEMLLELIEPARLVAVTPYIDTPGMSNSVGAVPRAVQRLQANAEAVIALQPDLALVATYSRSEEVQMLVAAGIPLLRLSAFASFHEVMDNLRLLGAAVGAEARAARLITQMQQRLLEVERRVQGRPRPRVLYYALGGHSVGADTLIDDIITRAGGTNVAREAQLTGWPRMPLELVLRLQPEVVILPVWNTDPVTDVVRTYLPEPAWQQVPAVQQGRVYAISGAWLTTVSQHAVRGLEALARHLHPEGFES